MDSGIFFWLKLLLFFSIEIAEISWTVKFTASRSSHYALKICKPMKNWTKFLMSSQQSTRNSDESFFDNQKVLEQLSKIFPQQEALKT